jgi:hypothetical protein
VWKTFILRNFSLSDYCGEQNDGNFKAWCNIEKDYKSGKFCGASFICMCRMNEHGDVQGGSERAEDGEKIAAQLTIKSCSERRLALCCKFYLTYSGILQAVSAKFESTQNEFQKIGQTLPDQSFSAQSGLPENERSGAKRYFAFALAES